MSEYIIRVRFECDPDDYKEPSVVLKEVFVHNDCFIGIPTKQQIGKSTREAGFTEANIVTIKVFKEIE
jgi:hypothetical protein